ncbi:MAG TPA: class I SAM-dependent methyltransferase, partial [Polyangiaceae bacterium]|nr:class I SAM-dependent methyltransferase [Polyangiaceae bacterium]
FEYLLTTGLEVHGAEALRQRPLRAGTRVLDIGCGFGDTTRTIAAQVGPHGQAWGVDCAGNFIRRASEDAQRSGVRNATFFVADVQGDDLRGEYDRAFSRFGTMFFALPGLALRNIRRGLAPGGELTMVVWRRREDNPWLHEAEKRVKALLPAREATDDVHCGPGPFSMASRELVSDLLQSAGYDGITFARFDADICIGRDLDDAVEFAMALGPAGEMIRLAGAEGKSREPRIRQELRDTLLTFARPDGVWGGSSTWIVSARNPAEV